MNLLSLFTDEAREVEELGEGHGVVKARCRVHTGVCGRCAPSRAWAERMHPARDCRLLYIFILDRISSQSLKMNVLFSNSGN